MNTVFTIGFSGKDARTFFETLKNNKIKTLFDVRLNNISQLSGYTKKNDLIYFLEKICAIPYMHLLMFAPTKEILDDYKHKKISWQEYERKYKTLIDEREVKRKIINLDFTSGCLLCSEKTAEYCHRRLVAEFLQKEHMIEKIIHL